MRRFLSLIAGLMLASCAYALEGSLQDVTFETPGAENAVCYLHESGVRRLVRPPQTVSVKKSDETLELECKAPGNRTQTVYLEPETVDAIALDIGTGLVPGLAADYATGAMFAYPELVQVDFTGILPRPNPLPAYHASDIIPPMTRGIEEYGSGQPALTGEGGAVPNAFEKYEDAKGEAPLGEPQPEKAQEFRKTTDNLAAKYNPSVFGGPAESSDSSLYYAPPGEDIHFPSAAAVISRPVPLYPAE